jgi:predicted nucleic acid-binding protein
MTGLTFDTGALIGLERHRHAIRKVFATAVTHGVPITVPAVVIVEWWRRGVREKERAVLLRALRIEPLQTHVAKLAGSAVGRVPGSGPIDAVVMASAAQRGDIVYTSDPDDLEALRAGVAELAHVRIAVV